MYVMIYHICNGNCEILEYTKNNKYQEKTLSEICPQRNWQKMMYYYTFLFSGLFLMLAYK